MKIKYNYSKKGQLHNPQKYQKTPFEGKKFLLSYQNFREKNIKNLKQKIEDKKDFNEIIKNFQIEKCDDIKFSTRILLKSILKENVDSEKYDKIVNVLIKKFEVKKRIFSSYDKLFFENSSNYQDMINYILLSNICAKQYEKTKNLKFLNTVLKLNDLICSEIENIEENIELNLSLHCLNKELDFVLKLKEDI